MHSLKTVRSAFPVRHRVAQATLNFSQQPEPQLLHAIAEVIKPTDKARPNRIKGVLASGDKKFFIKVQRVEALPKKLRIAFGRPKRSGRYDWPVEELLNSYIAAERGAETARVVAFGVVTARFGVVQDYVFLTEFLDDHLNGLQWLERNPERAPDLVKACMKLIMDMHGLRLTHLDLWIANVMVPEQTLNSLRVIDLENVFTRQSDFNADTLGFQLGFLYRKELYRFIDEQAYDGLVAEFLAEQSHVDRAAFQRTYSVSKHNKLSHKRRRSIFLEGKLSLV